jgi:hypothetical protein
VSTRIFSLALLAVLSACGGGTIRPSDDPEAIAPAPSPAPSTPIVDPDPAPRPSESPPASPRAAPDTTPSEVEIRRIGRWIGSGIKGARQLVIRDAATWAQFWSELGAGVRPQVDFGRDLVIAVASGERSSGGHDIEVQKVTRTGGELRIEVLRTAPGKDCMATTALTQPVDVVMVPAAGVTGWSFIDRAATRAC